MFRPSKSEGKSQNFLWCLPFIHWSFPLILYLIFFAFAPDFAWCECALTFHGLELLCIHRDEAANKNRYTYSYYPLVTGLHLGILCSQMDGQTLKPVFLAQGKQRSCWQLYWKSKVIPEVMIVKVSAPFKSGQWSGSACYTSGFCITLRRQATAKLYTTICFETETKHRCEIMQSITLNLHKRINKIVVCVAVIIWSFNQKILPINPSDRSAPTLPYRGTVPALCWPWTFRLLKEGRSRYDQIQSRQFSETDTFQDYPKLLCHTSAALASVNKIEGKNNLITKWPKFVCTWSTTKTEYSRCWLWRNGCKCCVSVCKCSSLFLAGITTAMRCLATQCRGFHEPATIWDISVSRLL